MSTCYKPLNQECWRNVLPCVLWCTTTLFGICSWFNIYLLIAPKCQTHLYYVNRLNLTFDIKVMGTKDQTASEQSAYTKKKNQMFTKIQFSSVLITISHIWWEPIVYPSSWILPLHIKGEMIDLHDFLYIKEKKMICLVAWTLEVDRPWKNWNLLCKNLQWRFDFWW